VRTVLASLVAAALFFSPALALAQEEVPPDTVIQAALDAASAELGVPVDNLVVVMTAQRDWPDSSLGCPEPGRAYAQVITPGFVVTIDSDDLINEVQVHTDRGTRALICSALP
jgi:hypothetical protein